MTSATFVPTPDQVKQAQELINFLQKNPAKHQQKAWMVSPDAERHQLWDDSSSPITAEHAFDCGTAACAAGWKAILDDKEVFVDHAGGAYVVEPDSERTSSKEVQDYSAQALGLPEYGFGQYPHMFSPENTIEDLDVWVSVMRESSETGTDVRAVAARRAGEFSWEFWTD